VAAGHQRRRQAQPQRRQLRRLSTSSGQNGSAAVLGTTWLIRDQCDGTYFYVKSTSNDPKGAILVTVLHPHRHTVRLKRGHSLLAPAPGY
jgi:hypothetical protein